MAIKKSSKVTSAIDMTAMCDVAFLLLTFFILTATAKVPEPISVEVPSSTKDDKLPEDGLVTITVGSGKDNVFVDIEGRELREKTLEFMSAKYEVGFTVEQSKEFQLMESFGTPITELGSVIDLKSERNKAGVQKGIPFTDTLGAQNQLKDWIFTARQANLDLLGPKANDLKFAVKGDAKLQYPKIKKIMDILQDQNINTFDLVTGLRGKDY